jgi:hypothetical protein
MGYNSKCTRFEDEALCMNIICLAMRMWEVACEIYAMAARYGLVGGCGKEGCLDSVSKSQIRTSVGVAFLWPGHVEGVPLTPMLLSYLCRKCRL